MQSILKLFLDFFPLGAFFIAYKLEGMMVATAVILACTFISLGITYVWEKRISPAPLISGILAALLGGMTLALQNETFIKIKPTLVNVIFAAVLLGGAAYGKPLLKYLLQATFQMTETGWMKLSVRWGIFFLLLALLNEMVWRNFPDDVWVNFKVFAIMPLTLAFAAAQWPLIKNYMVESEG